MYTGSKENLVFMGCIMSHGHKIALYHDNSEAPLVFFGDFNDDGQIPTMLFDFSTNHARAINWDLAEISEEFKNRILVNLVYLDL